MEVAGVVLGAVALVGPVHDLYDKCTTLFANIRNYTNDLRRCGEKLSIQKFTFLQSLQLLLRNLVQDDLAESMAKDKSHQKWKDLKFKADWDKAMGKCFDDLLGGIHETLREIEGKLSRLHASGGANQGNTSVSRSSNIVSREKITAWTLRTGWAVSGKKEIEVLINTLRVQNQDLGNLQRQQNSLQKIGASPRPQAFRSKPLDSKAILAQLLAISEVAKRVYDGLAVTARCSCHRVNLQLRGQPESPNIPMRNTSLDLTYNTSNLTKSPSAVNFYLILTKDIGNQDINLSSDDHCECTCITISSEIQQSLPGNPNQKSHGIPDPKRIIKFGDIETSSARAIITMTDDSQPSKKRAMSIDLGTGKKRLKLEFSETNHKAHPATICTATVDIQTNNITHDIDENSATLSITSRDIIEIDSLCLRLAMLRPDVRERELLGKIPINERDNLTRHSYLMYREPLVSDFASRTSLEAILTRPDKECLLPPVERLKIAHRLSLSLLYFGPSSPSWFQERWRSRDIFFFLKLQLPDNEYTLDPYVVPCFSAAAKPPSIDGKTPTTPLKGIALNEQLFSLAIVLIEIAFGEKLLNIYEPKEIPKKDGDDFTEILKARSILGSNSLLKKIGPVYSNVVKRCLDCRFDGTLEYDLSNIELRKIYYEQVVCELERCLKAVQKMHEIQ